MRERLAATSWRPDDPDHYCPKCGHTAGPHESTDQGCRRCSTSKLPWQRIIRLGDYEPPLSTIIQEIKYTRWRRLGNDAGRLLARQVTRQIQQHRESLGPALARPPVLIPVPMSMIRKFRRGIDHTGTIARGMQPHLSCDLAFALRRKHRPSQVSVAPHLRASNVAGTMWLRIKPARLSGRLVILVDDVTTTGATMKAAAEAILREFRDTTLQNARNTAQNRPKSPIESPQLIPPLIWVAVISVTEPEE